MIAICFVEVLDESDLNQYSLNRLNRIKVRNALGHEFKTALQISNETNLPYRAVCRILVRMAMQNELLVGKKEIKDEQRRVRVIHLYKKNDRVNLLTIQKLILRTK
ncbi:MAG: hypothetical protein RLZZ469_1653 [Bacteroidota bacterium]|jgi:hypothetical protein